MSRPGHHEIEKEIERADPAALRLPSYQGF